MNREIKVRQNKGEWMNGRQILAAWLKDHGFDGLFNSDVPCGCLVADLMPCGGCPDECHSGYRVDCKRKDCETCEGCDGYTEGQWRVQGEKL